MEGALRPFPGFRLLDDGLALNANETLTDGDFFVVTLREGASTVRRCYVYRTANSSDNKFDIYVAYDGPGSGLVTAQLKADVGDGAMDVAFRGRICYVFIRGAEPISFYFDGDAPLIINTDTGPGPQPSVEKAAVSGADAVDNSGADAVGNNGGAFDGLVVGGVFTATSASTTASGTGTSGVPAENSNAAVELQPANYGYAYRLENPEREITGPLSPVMLLRQGDFPNSGDDDAFVVFEANVKDPDATSPTPKYTHMTIYRTAASDGGNPEVQALQGTLFEEAFIKLSDFTVATDSAPSVKTGFKKIRYNTVNTDRSLVQANPYTNRDIFEEEIPKGGTAIVYSETMLVSDIAGADVGQESVGEIRFSGTLDDKLNLFPPLNRVVPESINDDVVAFKLVGSNVAGLARSRVYIGRIESGYLNMEGIHAGYGTDSKRGAEVAGQFVYYSTPKGLYTLGTRGEFNSVSSVDALWRDEWRGKTDKIIITYDPETSVVWVINPDTKGAVLIWLTTSKITELHSIPFVAADRGLVPAEPTKDFERAIFATRNGRLYVHDRLREGTKQNPLFQPPGGADQIVNVTLTNGQDGALTGVSAGSADAEDFIDLSYAVVSENGYGREGLIEGAGVNGGQLTDVTLSDTSLNGEFTIAIGGHVCRYKSAPLPVSSGGQSMGMLPLNTRHVSNAQAYFDDPEGGQIGDGRDYYTLELYEGNENEPRATGIPTSGGGDLVSLMVDRGTRRATAFNVGQAQRLNVPLAGFRVSVYDLDFRAIAMRVHSRITDITTPGPRSG